MKTREDIELLEKLVGQLQGLHDEITQLSKKSPNDGLNPFKLKLVNRVLDDANSLLNDRYRPFDDFEQFDNDDLPSNSDATMMLGQYMEQIERFRSDQVVRDRHGAWHYLVDGQPSNIASKPPTRVGVSKK
tara:strand:- start:1561 stop:1953 length:393 start_codon:yes stop_codon:yes gene_type:complete